MKIYKRILALDDFSAQGTAAARHAFLLSLRHGALLGLGHVVDWEIGADEFVTATPIQIQDRLRTVVKRKLAKTAERIGALNVQTCVGFRSANQGLADIMRGWQPDLLVVGSKAAYGLETAHSTASLGWTADIEEMSRQAPGQSFANLFQALARL